MVVVTKMPDEIDEILALHMPIDKDHKKDAAAIKQAILALKKKWLIDEIKIMQHQAFNVLKSAKAVGEWGDIRINQLNGDK